jgi:ABC-type sugar transport system permease subunit
MQATSSRKRFWLPSPLLLFLLPALLLIVVFFVVPIGITGVISLTSLDYRFRWDFVGLANFVALLQDALIPRVLLNTGATSSPRCWCFISAWGSCWRCSPPLYRRARRCSSA